MNQYHKEILAYLKDQNNHNADRHSIENYLHSLHKKYVSGLTLGKDLLAKGYVSINDMGNHYYLTNEGLEYLKKQEIPTLELKAFPTRILKYIQSTGGVGTIGEIKSHFIGSAFNHEMLDNLKKNNFIEVNDLNVSLSVEGANYLEKYDDFGSVLLFKEEINLAILQFLYIINEPVNFDSFPKSIISHIRPQSKAGSDYINFRSFLEINSPLKKYIDIRNNSVQINEWGKKYYEHIKEEYDNNSEQIINTFTIDNSMHTHGDNSPVSGRDMKIHGIENKNNTIQEAKEDNQLAKKNYRLNKQILIWTIAGILIAAILSILIARHVI